MGWKKKLQVALKKAVNAYKIERIEEVIRILLEYGVHAEQLTVKA